MAQATQHQQHVICHNCNNRMELYMARSEYMEIIMTFECSSCNQHCELVAKTKPPSIKLELH